MSTGESPSDPETAGVRRDHDSVGAAPVTHRNRTAPPQVPEPDLAEAQFAVELFCEEGFVHELRVLGDDRHGIRSGYFDNHDKLAADLVAASATEWGAECVSITINPVKPELLARANNRMRDWVKRGDVTADAQILCRRWLLLDLDPKRASGISATDEEHTAGLACARDICAYTSEVRGWLAPLFNDSGNGAHLLYPIDLPNDDETTALLKRVLLAFARLFDGEVEIDQQCFNAARILKVPGTVARKGDHLPDRPHRLSRVVDPGNGRAKLVSREELEEFANSVLVEPQPKPVRQQNPNNGNSRGSTMAEFLAKHGIVVQDQQPYKDGTKFIPDHCPFNREHTGSSVAFFEWPNGAKQFICKHKECGSRTWHDVIKLVEPHKLADNDEKKAMRDELIGLARSRAKFYRHGEVAYAKVEVGTHVETHKIPGAGFRRWLRQIYFEQNEERSPDAESLKTAMESLEAYALFKGEKCVAALRIAGDVTAGEVFVDLCNDDWEVVRIDQNGWEVIPAADCPYRFTRRHGMLPLPLPESGGTIELLRDFLPGDDDDDFKLVVGWLIASCNPQGPYPILELGGDHGAGKSTTARVLRNCIDPNTATIRAEPRNIHDLMIAATCGWVVALDNLSGLQRWLSDALSRLSTRAGFSTREYYTDDQEKIFDATRPIIVTGIGGVLTKPDILDRAIRVDWEEISAEKRMTESKFDRRFAVLQPQIMGAIFNAVACALRRRDQITVSNLPRMADAAVWVEAAAEAFGWKPGEFLGLYQKNRTAANEEVLDDSIVARVLLAALQMHGRLQGTAAQLLKILNEQMPEDAQPEGWPKSSRGFGKALRKIKPNLSEAGIKVEFGRAARKRSLTITRNPEAPAVDPVEPPESVPSAEGGAATPDNREALLEGQFDLDFGAYSEDAPPSSESDWDMPLEYQPPDPEDE